MVSNTIVVPPKQKIEPKAIKSYIYTPPRKETKAVLKDKTLNKTVEESPEQQSKEQPKEIPSIIDDVIKSEKKEQKTAELPSNDDKNEAVNHDKDPKVPMPINSPKRKFSALNQLSKLKSNLDKYVIEQEAFEYDRPRTGSVMHGTPILVPHSTQQLTEDEKKEQATYQMSSGLKMIKGDDGTCFVERDLGEVGMEGLKSVEGFSCGQSKFNKNFKEHMEQVRKKLGK